MRETRPPRRATFVACLLATIGAGLLVHLRGDLLGDTGQDVTGDALWAAMLVWWIALLSPQRPILQRAVIAYGICAAVETSQLVHTPWLDAVRATLPGHLVLGSGFDARDLVAYAAGIVAAVLFERVVLVRSAMRSTGR